LKDFHTPRHEDLQAFGVIGAEVYYKRLGEKY